MSLKPFDFQLQSAQKSVRSIPIWCNWKGEPPNWAGPLPSIQMVASGKVRASPEGFLFRATDPKGRVSSNPFVGSSVANRLRLHLTTLNIDQGETMHSFRSSCSITLSIRGASDDQVAAGKAFRRLSIILKSQKLWISRFRFLFLLRAPLKGRIRFPILGAEFRARNNLEEHSLAFP